MRISYDAEVDAMSIKFDISATDRYLQSDEVKPGIVFDYDIEGRILGIEILNASHQLSASVFLDIKAT